MEVLRSSLTPYLFVLPAMGFLPIFIYAPAVENIRYSLYSWSSLSPDWKYIGLANYKALSADPIFWRALTDSAIYGVISVAVQVFVALALAAVLEANVFGRRLKAFFRA